MPQTPDDAHDQPPLVDSSATVDNQINISVERPAAGQVVIEVDGEVDMLTSPQLLQVALDELTATSGSDLVVLALDEVDFLGTSGLAVLIELRDNARSSGVTLRIACTERRVLRPLAIAGLEPLFDIRTSVSDALSNTNADVR